MTMFQELLYATWRFDMWGKGYGSYRVIDRAVAMGVLVPGKTYPERTKQRGMTFSDWLERKLS